MIGFSCSCRRTTKLKISTFIARSGGTSAVTTNNEGVP